MNDNAMFRTKINLLTRKTVLKVSLFQTYYYYLKISADFFEALKFQFLSRFCTGL